MFQLYSLSSPAWCIIRLTSSTLSIEQERARGIMAVEHTRMMRIESYHKEGNRWIYDAVEAEDEFQSVALHIRFPVAALYEDVLFAQDEN